jgi:hypothetical protein
MAFGGSGDNVEIKVTLDTKGAEVQAAKFQSSVKDAFGKIQTAAQSPITAVQNIGKEFLESSPSVAKFSTAIEGASASLVPLAAAAATATAGVALLAIGFNKLISIAAEGDRFGDVAEAFAENALQAGVAADVLERELGQALNNTVSRTNLLIAANKAFAAGIDPRVFDDLAAASKRYADSVGIDATQALDTFINAVRTGRTGILEQIGTIENGTLVLKKFTEEQFNVAQANRNVTDTAEQLSAKFASVYESFAIALNNSKALQLATELLGGALLKLAEILGTLGQGIIYVADLIAGEFQRRLDGINATIAFTSSIISDLASGSLPDFSKATDAGTAALKKVEAAAKDAGTVSIKLKKGLDDVAGSAKKVAKDVPSAADEIATLANKTTTSIEKAFGFKTQLETKIQNEVTAAFKAFKGDDGALVAALDKINRDILAKITDPEKAKEAAKILTDTIESEIKKADISVSLDADSDFSKRAGDAIEQGITSALSTAVSAANKAITDGLGREDVQGIGTSLGQGIGSAVGAAFGAPEVGGAIGSILGTIAGKLASQVGKDTAGTKARKAADAFFADVFDAQRLSVIINGQIKQIQDLQFTGNEDATFEGVAPQVQASFQAVGAAFEQLLGISEDYSGRIASVLLGNIGDSLVNLQALVQSTGKSFEDLGNAIFEAFFNGSLSIQEAQNALVKLNEVFQVGIPGQIGAIDQAVQNLQVSLANDKGSRIIFNSLRGIGAEALEVGKNLGQAAQSIAAGLGLGADKVTLFLQAMKLAGINSVQELVDASNAKLLALAANIKQVTAGEAPTNTEVTIPTTSITSGTNFSASSLNTGGGRSSGGGSRGISKAEQERKKAEAERLRRFQALQNETLKAVTASTAYKSILDQITAGTIDSNVAGNKLNELYSNQFKVLETLRNAQEAYDKALKNGTKGKDLTALAAALEKAQKAADGLKAPLANISKLDLKNVVGAIKDLNQLGIISQISGLKVEELQNTLTAGFLRGLISITEYNERLKATKDLLGAGIPGAVGAFEKAFANIANAGRAGGVFLIDAIRDVAAEFDEFFKQNSSSARKKQLQELRGNFDNARDAVQSAIASGAPTRVIQSLQETFDAAKKAFDDFQSSSNRASIGDLKTELQKTFDPGQVDIYFEALRQNGITSIEQLTGASNEQLTTIAATLDELGFNFKATNGDIKNLLDNTNKAVADAAGGKDPLITALDATKSLQENIAALASPMGTLQSGFEKVLQTLDLFKDKTFNTTVLLNVKTVYDGQAENLVTAIFGDGGVAAPQSPETPGPSPATPGKKLNDAQRKEFDALRRKKRRTSAEQARLEALQVIRSGA